MRLYPGQRCCPGKGFGKEMVCRPGPRVDGACRVADDPRFRSSARSALRPGGIQICEQLLGRMYRQGRNSVEYRVAESSPGMYRIHCHA